MANNFVEPYVLKNRAIIAKFEREMIGNGYKSLSEDEQKLYDSVRDLIFTNPEARTTRERLENKMIRIGLKALSPEDRKRYESAVEYARSHREEYDKVMDLIYHGAHF